MEGEDRVLFAWDDADHIGGPGLLNAVRVARAGPMDVLITTQHGPTATVVKLPRGALEVLVENMTEHLAQTRPESVVAQALVKELPGTNTMYVSRHAANIVKALREQGYLT